MKKIFLLTGVIFSLVFAVAVSAQGLQSAGDVLKSVGGNSGEKIGVSADLAGTMATVIKTILALVGTIFLVLTIYAGIIWMTAAGNDEQVTKATGMIKSAVIGLVIVMSAYAITYFITTRLTGAVNLSNETSSQTAGCCFTPGYTSCAPATQTECDDLNSAEDPTLWQAGSCSSQCPN
jgi:cytochrome bd-type quinol oxidase subunit 2